MDTNTSLDNALSILNKSLSRQVRLLDIDPDEMNYCGNIVRKNIFSVESKLNIEFGTYGSMTVFRPPDPKVARTKKKQKNVKHRNTKKLENTDDIKEDPIISIAKLFNIEPIHVPFPDFSPYIDEMNDFLTPRYVGDNVTTEDLKNRAKYSKEYKYLNDIWNQNGSISSNFGKLTFVKNAFSIECCAWGNPNQSIFLRKLVYYVNQLNSVHKVTTDSDEYERKFILGEKITFMFLNASNIEHSLWMYSKTHKINMIRFTSLLSEVFDFLITNPDVHTKKLKDVIGPVLLQSFAKCTSGMFPKNVNSKIYWGMTPTFVQANVHDFPNDTEFFKSVEADIMKSIDSLSKYNLPTLISELTNIISAPLNFENFMMCRILSA